MKRSLAVILALLLCACGLLPDVKDETSGWSAEKLYAEAKSEIANNGYANAIKYLERLEARYPYGRYAQQAQMELAYVYFKDGEHASAIAACDRFIKLHPNHANVDYIYYLKGLVNFNEDTGLLGRLSRQDLTERDPKAARESFDAFKELVTRYPNSKYTPDGIARMKYLVNALASNEVHVARYYMKRGAYVAAANRAQYALLNYAQAPAVEEALFIMVKAYDALGMTDLRDDTDRVMRKNFPDSAYFKGAPGKKDPWWLLWG
ncbi:MAG: outer membrane protein assembly factor BamD, partial [Pseudomonadota bacterium]